MPFLQAQREFAVLEGTSFSVIDWRRLDRDVKLPLIDLATLPTDQRKHSIADARGDLNWGKIVHLYLTDKVAACFLTRSEIVRD